MPPVWRTLRSVPATRTVFSGWPRAISGPASPSAEPRKPTGPLLRGGYSVSVHPHHRYYGPIRPSRRLPPTSRLLAGYREGLCRLAAPERVPALGRCSLHTCRHPYAERRPGCTCPILPQVQGLPPQWTESTPLIARRRLLSGYYDDAAVFASCCGPRGSAPSCSSPTWSRAPAVEGSYFQAFPRPGRPSRESDMIIGRYGGRRSPARTPPLQAATIGVVQRRTRAPLIVEAFAVAQEPPQLPWGYYTRGR
jgi:hypothetical protein